MLICKKIEKLWREFLWNRNHDEKNHFARNKKKLHPIIWSIVTTPKYKGGLELSSIGDTNYALLRQWLWRYHTEPSALWKKFIGAKYNRDPCKNFPISSKFSSMNAPWRSIIKKGVDWFNSQIHWKINNEKSLTFSHSMWSHKSPRKITTSRLFALFQLQNTSIKEVWEWQHWGLGPSQGDYFMRENTFYGTPLKSPSQPLMITEVWIFHFGRLMATVNTRGPQLNFLQMPLVLIITSLYFTNLCGRPIFTKCVSSSYGLSFTMVFSHVIFFKEVKKVTRPMIIFSSTATLLSPYGERMKLYIGLKNNSLSCS